MCKQYHGTWGQISGCTVAATGVVFAIGSFGTLSQHTQCFDPDLATTHDCVRCLSSKLFHDDCCVTGAAPYLAMNQEQLL